MPVRSLSSYSTSVWASAKYGVALYGQRQDRVAGKEGDGGSKWLNWISVMSRETKTVPTGRWV